MSKVCFYCSEQIDTANDDYEKVGKKYICAFCWEEAEESDNQGDEIGDESLESED